MWERIDDDDDDDDLDGEVVTWERIDTAPTKCEKYDSIPVHSDSSSGNVVQDSPSNWNTRKAGRPVSVHSGQGRHAKAQLKKLSILQLRDVLSRYDVECSSICVREELADQVLKVLGVERVLREVLEEPLAGMSACQPSESHAPMTAPGVQTNVSNQSRVDYTKFNRINFAGEYDVHSDDEEEAQLPDLKGTPFEGIDPIRMFHGELSTAEKQHAFQQMMQHLDKMGGLKAPPAPPAPDCSPIVDCRPPACKFDYGPTPWAEPDHHWHDVGSPEEADSLQRERAPASNYSLSEPCTSFVDTVHLQDRIALESVDMFKVVWEKPDISDDEDMSSIEGRMDSDVIIGHPHQQCSHQHDGGNDGSHWQPLHCEGSSLHDAGQKDFPSDSMDAVQRNTGDQVDTVIEMEPQQEHLSVCVSAPNQTDAETDMFKHVSNLYDITKKKLSQEAHVLEGTDVDGWSLDRSQFDLVEEADEDLMELKILLACCTQDGNRERLSRAIREFQIKLRVKRTWAWFPLTSYEWSGYEFEKPVVILDFKVPGVGGLLPDDVHCDFGVDWFDLKVWNVEWPEDPGVKYHHRIKKTRLMRDIVPAESFIKASGDHIYIHLKKVYEPRHGYCAWPDLAAGKGRKPFKYNEDAPDGGLMEFFEGEYEKHEGYDGFRRDIGKAMEKIHRHEPIRGIPDTPIEDD